MKQFTQKYLFLYLLLIFILNYNGIAFTAEVPNVIIITIKGVRNKDSISDPTHQYIPNLWFKMKQEGTLYVNLVDFNRQFHMPVIGCINSGKWCFFTQDIDSPTIFQYARRAYQWPKNKLWSIGEWDNQSSCKSPDYPPDTYPCRLTSLGINLPAELNQILTDQERLFFRRYKNLEGLPVFFWSMWDSLNEVEQRIIKKVMRTFKPKLIHYVMSATESAHFDGYGRYVISLKRADEMIFEIWQMIRNDPFYRDNTYLIVSPDHERNAYHMDHDENPISNPSKVWLYIYGPQVKKGIMIKNTIYRIDVFPTVSAILGLKVKQGNGRILKECFLEGFQKKLCGK